MGRGQNMNSKRSLKEVESNLHGWLWGVQDSSEVTVDVAETARELKLEMEPEDVTKLRLSYDKTWTDENLHLMNEQGK